jgi:hypothetical protein
MTNLIDMNKGRKVVMADEKTYIPVEKSGVPVMMFLLDGIPLMSWRKDTPIGGMYVEKETLIKWYEDNISNFSLKDKFIVIKNIESLKNLKVVVR